MSSSPIFLELPSEISGLIQETVINCHKVKSSSGLRRPDVGGPNGGLMPSFGNRGSRSGMRKIKAIVPAERMIASIAGTSMRPSEVLLSTTEIKLAANRDT